MKKLYLLFLLAIPLLCPAQEKWELKKSEDGITVYTRRLNTEKFKEIRAVCDFNASQEQLVKILQNVNHHKDWVYGTRQSYLLSRKNKDTLYYYSEVELPWPMSNRDLAIQLSFSRDTITNILRIQARCMPKLVPEKPGIVRVPYSLALWNVSTLPNKHIKIDYTFSVDPGGALPAWLVNYTATAGPFNTFKKLKAMLESKGP